MNRLNGAYPFLRTSLLDADIAGLIDGVRDVHAAQVALGGNVVPSSVRELVDVVETRFRGAAKLQGGGGAGAALLVLSMSDSTSELEHLMIQRGYRQLPFQVDARGVSVLEDASPGGSGADCA